MAAFPVLVTGASGFVGLHLLERLAAQERRVLALHHRELAQDLRGKFGARVQWLRADIASEDLGAILEGVGTVFHLAAHATPSEVPAEVERMQRVNVTGTQLVAAAARRAGVRRFIFVSSIAACETAPVADVDEDNGQPVSSYGKSKRAAERELLALHDAIFAVTILRPAALFGEDHLGSVYELVRAIQGGRFVIIGAGRNCTNFYYIGDFIDVLLAVEAEPRAHGQVFIASDAPRTLESLVADIRTVLRRDQPVRRIPVWLGYALGGGLDAIAALTGRSLPLSVRRVRAMTRDVRYRNDKLVRVLGLHPQRGLTAGLRDTIEWYRGAGLL